MTKTAAIILAFTVMPSNGDYLVLGFPLDANYVAVSFVIIFPKGRYKNTRK